MLFLFPQSPSIFLLSHPSCWRSLGHCVQFISSIPLAHLCPVRENVSSTAASLATLLAASVTCPLWNRGTDLPLQGIPQSVLHRGTCPLCLRTRLLGIMESRNASASAFALLCSECSLLGIYRNHKAFQKVTVRKFLNDVVYPDVLET